jgi:hypothetical protein
MAAHGEIGPMPDAAIFADTMAEPASVYEWLDWLEPLLPFPVVRVSRGDLTEESLAVKEFKNDPSRHWVKSLIPAFIENPAGWYPAKSKDDDEGLLFDVERTERLVYKEAERGIMGRRCTFSYKVEQLEKAARKLAGIKRGQKDLTVTQWIGISWDEAQRMKPARFPWTQHRWPLVELRMKREHCLKWMEDHGYPKPPRSACVYCPFHSNAEWRRLRDDEPKEFQRAVKFEKALQAAKAKTDNQRGKPFLHPSLIPLDEVDLRDENPDQMQLLQDFRNECTGMCGV